MPGNVKLSPGRIEITADSATSMVEALVSLAMVMQNDLARWQRAIEPPPAQLPDAELEAWLSDLRGLPREQGRQDDPLP